MITGVHMLVHAEDAEAARAFFRDVLEWRRVHAHDGWLIFGSGPSELGVHPAAGGAERHEISLVCDHIEETIAALRAKGARFVGDIDTRLRPHLALDVPGAGQMQLYEPRHPTAFDLCAQKATREPEETLRRAAWCRHRG